MLIYSRIDESCMKHGMKQRCVLHWLERLPDIRLDWVRKPAMAGKHLHQFPFIEEVLREINVFYDSGC